MWSFSVKSAWHKAKNRYNSKKILFALTRIIFYSFFAQNGLAYRVALA
ncbi:hypothetical protein PALB_3570 [Pseudoalteromonas luteoviolacea B = ATCC 29581]|nr:hypothetical protein PALB_3570 [Pseudoalteromonas luteoviolacea B = ATCC 29581]